MLTIVPDTVKTRSTNESLDQD